MSAILAENTKSQKSYFPTLLGNINSRYTNGEFEEPSLPFIQAPLNLSALAAV